MRVTMFTAAVALSLAAGSCTKSVAVDLTIVEPCGQDNQALNGVQSFRMLSNGAGAEGDNVVAFRSTDPAGMAVGLGEGVIITVEGYADDITLTDNPTAPPDSVKPAAVGRTMPLLIDEATAAVKGTVLVGKVDSFGAPRDLEGNCSSMDNDSAIAGRHGHTATYIPVVNKVLIFGGAVWSTEDGLPVETFLKSAELFDPTTGVFTKLPAARNTRAYHTATALPDGRVVVWGGLSTLNGQTSTLINAEVIDVRVEANPYVATLLTDVARAHHTATLLADIGVIAIVGGCTGGTADGCTPTSASGTSTTGVPVEILNINDLVAVTATGTLGIPRAMHQAVGFPGGNNGVVAIVGGLNASGALRGVELLQVDGGDDLANRNNTADALPRALVRHQAIVLNAGLQTFVVTGGQDVATNGVLSAQAAGTDEMVSCSIVDAVISCLGDPNPKLQGPRFGHAMARLRDGTLVVIGGVAPAAASAEALRVSAGSGDITWQATAGALGVARDRAAFTTLGGDSFDATFVNQVFYSGGYTTTAPFTTSNATDIYFGR